MARERDRQRAESIYLVRVSGPLHRSIAQAHLASDWARVIALYDTLLIHEPRRAQAYFERGLAKFRLRDTAGARLDLLQARQLGKRVDEYLDAAGSLAVVVGSEVPFQPAGGGRGRFALLDRANRARDLGYLGIALATFDSALARDSTFDHAYAARGRLRLAMGDTVAARTDFRDAERHSTDAAAKATYRNLALSLEPDSVRSAEMRRTLGKNPGNPPVWYQVLTRPWLPAAITIAVSIVLLIVYGPRRR